MKLIKETFFKNIPQEPLSISEAVDSACDSIYQTMEPDTRIDCVVKIVGNLMQVLHENGVLSDENVLNILGDSFKQSKNE